MNYEQPSKFQIALDDFRRARRLAATNEILRRIKGQPVNLLPFEEIRQHITPEGVQKRGLQHIPIDAIVGSVGRYADFTRDFLPRSRSLQERWAHVRSVFQNVEDMPPIEVYQIGEVYFVLDGNHRVSIARERGAESIRAYVTELVTSIQIHAESDLDSLILEAEREGFLARTRLHEMQPPPDLQITSPGRYRIIEHQIEALQKQLSEDQHKEIVIQEAAQQWYQQVYRPVEEIISTHNLLRDFPERTATDLYVWISQHREDLQNSLGWAIDPEDAAIDLADQFSSRPERRVARWGERILESVTPPPIEPVPKPGEWRQQLSVQRREHLFNRILVAISGTTQSWDALKQATVLAQRENANLLGLHVVPNEKDIETDKTHTVAEQFNRICEASGIPGEFAIDTGDITPTICQRARWSDLVVVHLAHPPSQHTLKRLAPGFHRLVQRCPRPMLVVPEFIPGMDKLLLAYDGSPRADEALFVAAYLAGKWDLPLTVLIVLDGETFPKKAAARARWYLNSHKIIGDVHFQFGDIANLILHTADEGKFDLIIMGGYSYPPMLEAFIGSSVNQVLRSANCPVLICR